MPGASSAITLPLMRRALSFFIVIETLGITQYSPSLMS